MIISNVGTVLFSATSMEQKEKENGIELQKLKFCS